jgi:MFS family permease
MEETPEAITPAAAARARKAVTGAAIGFYVDMFDVYLPVIALAPALAYFVPVELDAAMKVLISAVVFVATLIARPVGSVIFGLLADRIGRRRATIYAVTGCATTTLATAGLPGYQQIGTLAVVALIATRFVGGVFMGGEYTGAVPLAMESSPISRRGRHSGVIAAAFPLAYCTISILTFLLLGTMSSDGVGSSYVHWGWRIPFVLGGIGTFWFARYYARSVQESESWTASKVGAGAASQSKIRTTLTGANRRSLIRIFILMTGVWFGSNVVSVLLPGLLRQDSDFSAAGATFVWIIVQLVLTTGYLYSGELSQRIGRRRFFLVCGLAMGTASAAAVTLVSTGTVSGYLSVTVTSIVAVLAGTTTFGAVPTMVCESFPVDVRGTGYGLGYSLAIVLPSFYALYQELLGRIMPSEYTPAVLLVLGGALVCAGALLGPETSDRDLAWSTADVEDNG